ncbi:MAG: argininosuccinate lyase [Acidobacteriota bacterium]
MEPPSRKPPAPSGPENEINPLWTGRLAASMAPLVRKYTSSLHLDRRLACHDLRGSRAHTRMLAQRGILSRADRDRIVAGLDQIQNEMARGEFPYREELEDIHMNIEFRLREIVGEAALHLQSGRSRNDQVALDLKLFSLQTAKDWQDLVLAAQRVLVARAEQLKQLLFPGWTHLQAAQPLSWGHYLLAFAEMLRRDDRRLAFYRELHSVSPLGAGALAGSTLNLDPEATAKDLGFRQSFGNSYDVAGDRDWVLELLQIGTQIMLHLSRLAEDLIYFLSTPVGWIELPDALCTGSSLMPQKRNPDILELMRGKAASVVGHCNALTVLIKGLPTSYHRDLQQDKEHLFRVVDLVTESLQVLPLLLSNFTVNIERVQAALRSGYLMATDLAEYLVGKGVPFRAAHQKVGCLVAHASRHGLRLENVPLEVIRQIAPECDASVRDILTPRAALERRRHKGSTGRRSIDRQIRHWREWFRERDGTTAADGSA